MSLERIINSLIDAGLLLGNKILWCIIILFVCTIALKIGQSVVNKFFHPKSAFQKGMTERKTNTLKSIILSVMRYVIYFIAIFSILTYLGVPVASLVTVAGVGSVAIGFGAQSLVQDLITGFFILLEDQYGVGDIVSIEGHTGTVEEITIRTTKLRAYDGTVYIVPNGKVQIVTNMCKDFINAVVDVDIDYAEDMEKVIDVLKDEMNRQEKKIQGLRSIPSVLGVIGLNESSVTVRVIAECEIKENYGVERQLRLAIKKRLDEEKITMPFPQRTIHIVKDVKEIG